MRERSKLRSTQSLPVNERTIQSSNEYPDNFINRLTIKPHHSLDTDLDTFTTTKNKNSNNIYNNYNLNNNNNNSNSSNNSSINIIDHNQHIQSQIQMKRDIEKTERQTYDNNNIFDRQKRENTLDRTEKQIKNLLIATSTAMTSTISANNNNNSNNNTNNNVFTRQQVPQLQRQKTDDVLDRPSRKHYEISKAATKSYYDDPNESLNRYESLSKTPVRRLDSGPSPARRDSRYENVPVEITSSTESQDPNFEIVLVGVSPIESPSDQYQRGITQKNNMNRTPNQPMPHPSESREYSSRSTDDDMNLNFNHSQSVPNYQNISFSSSSSPQLHPQSSMLTPPYSNIQFNTQQQEMNDDIMQKGFYSTPISNMIAYLILLYYLIMLILF